MALSLALYALGVSLESRPNAGASPLIAISIAFGVLATVIFLGDLGYLARKEIQRRRASRKPFPEYGALDYGPEFVNAVEGYVGAQEHITDATTRTSEAFEKNQALESQQEADECGAAADLLSSEFEKWLPEMDKNGEVARVCLKGYLTIVSRPATDADEAELRGLRESARGARISTTQYLHTLKGARKTVKILRSRNLSRSLNESSVRLEARLEEAIEIVQATARGFAVAERHITRRLRWYSVRARIAPSMGRDAQPS